MKLIKYIMENSKIEYGDVLDWWLSEGKFDNWKRVEVTRFTKSLHRLSGLSLKRDLHYASAKQLKFPKKAVRWPQLWLAKGDGEGKDWVRHIRNGIAHGHVEVRIIKGKELVEITDYSKSKNKQTAYILMEMEWLKDIWERYKRCKRARLE